VTVAGLALASHYLPDLPVPLILGLAAAILGLGAGTTEAVRSRVTPEEAARARELEALHTFPPVVLEPPKP
jgi:hypothetical protein